MSEIDAFTPPHPLKTAVLFLVFNRLDTTKKVFEAIRQAKPPRLYVAADGPRADHPGEDEKVQAVRDYILSSIDWDCEVKTLFRDENLGCKRAVSSAIDWFFSHVEEGIILEDDCVPDQSFFPFCQELLERYRDDRRIMMISGMNYLFNKIEIRESYYFSRYYPIWGWATWKRAWSCYDINMSEWPKVGSERYLNQVYCHNKIVNFLQDIFAKAHSNQIDTWDIQWFFTCIINYSLAICPKYNLISNIGITGSHADRADRFHFMPVKIIDVSQMVHPTNVMPNVTLDKICFDEITRDKPVYIRIMEKMGLR